MKRESVSYMRSTQSGGPKAQEAQGSTKKVGLPTRALRKDPEAQGVLLQGVLLTITQVLDHLAIQLLQRLQSLQPFTFVTSQA